MASGSLTGTQRETLSAFVTDEPMTTTEIADFLDLGRRSAYARLEHLAERGHIETKKVGANARVWWCDGLDMDSSRSGDEDASTTLATLVDAVDEYAIFKLDPDGRVRTWNTGASRIKGYDAEDVIGAHFSVFYTEEDTEAGIPERNLSKAAAEGSLEDEGWRVREDGSLFWAKASISAIRGGGGELEGFVKVTRDMTDRREYEAHLKAQAERLGRQRDELQGELNEVFERISDGFYALDDEFRFRYFNDHSRELLDLDDSAVGMDIRDVIDLTPAFEDALYDALETNESQIIEMLSDTFDRWFTCAIYPSDTGISVYYRDISDRKAQEREFERYVGLIEAMGEPVYELDANGCFVFVNEAFLEVTGYEEAELIGSHVSIGMDDDAIGRLESAIVDLLEAGGDGNLTAEFEIVTKSGDRIPVENRLSLVIEDGCLHGSVGTIWEITERKEREHELELYETIISTIDDGVYVLDEDYCFTEVNDAYVEMTGYDRETLIGSHCTLVIDESISDRSAELFTELVEDGIEGSATLEANILRADGSQLRAESKFTALTHEDEEPYEKVGVVRDVSDRVAREEELAALNHLNTVIREITAVVIERSTREEIEQTVCATLADTDAYEFAWIAEVDPDTDTFVARTAAGTGGYHEEATISIDPDEPSSNGPGPTAIREKEMQVVRDVRSDPRFSPWRDAARRYGFRSMAAIPIVHDGAIYGVIAVYADRHAFDTEEREVIEQLGLIVGHAIAAAERKQALMSDELVELEFEIRDVFDGSVPGADTIGPLAVDYVVPLGEEEFLAYGSVNQADVDTLSALVESSTRWESVTFRSRHDPARFELRGTGKTIFSRVAELGGYIDDVAIDDGDMQFTIHLAPTVETHQVIEAIEGVYPQAEMVRRVQFVRPSDDPHLLRRRLIADLSDRQGATLDAAYHAGYFAWPREATGESIAESMGVAPNTFHQHLRKAEQKVFDAIYLTPRLP